MPRRPLDLSTLKAIRLDVTEAPPVGAFSCGDPDLDDFICSDASRLQAEHVARTYLVYADVRMVGYFTLVSDAIRLTSNERKKLQRNGAGLKHDDHPVIPAVKLARLAVCLDFRGKDIGTHLVRLSCGLLLSVSESVGCRLLTVDSYPDSIGFYEKLGFVRNREKNYAEKQHPSMRLDVFGPALTWL